jgi:hypothetical protein
MQRDLFGKIITQKIMNLSTRNGSNDYFKICESEV